MPELGWKLIHRDGALWYEYIGEAIGPFSGNDEAEAGLAEWQAADDEAWDDDEDSLYDDDDPYDDGGAEWDDNGGAPRPDAADVTFNSPYDAGGSEFVNPEPGPTVVTTDVLYGPGRVVEGVGGDEIGAREPGVVEGEVDGGVAEDGPKRFDPTAIP